MIKKLIELFSKKEEKNNANNINKKYFSHITNDGMLTKFDERDLDANGHYTTPEDVVSIAQGAFESCQNLISVKIGDNVKYLGSGAFAGCLNLKKATLPCNLKNILSHTFNACRNLEEITWPENLQSIGCSAFFCCESLKSADLPDSLTLIHNGAFAYCNNLKSIRVPQNSNILVSPTVFGICPSKEQLEFIEQADQIAIDKNKGVTQ